MALRETDRRRQFPQDSIDDLIQAVYLHLVKQNNHALGRFKGKYEESIYRYLAVISINVVRDHFREIRAYRRPKVSFSLDDLLQNAGEKGVPIDAICDIGGQPLGSGKQKITMEDIDSALKKAAVRKHRDRDILIYKLRYLDGLTLEEIRNVLGLEMSSIGIGSVISRLNEKLRRRLGRLT
jgi:RNA polymerase sigma factor (sigma-70 family)